MRIQHRYLTFDKNEKLNQLLSKLSVRCKVIDRKLDETVNLYALEFHLYEDNPRFSELKSSFAEFKIEPQVGTVYENADYKNAEWFIISAGEFQYPQPEDNFGYLQATFNLDKYCGVCGTGKIQNGPYRLRTEPKQYNSQFWGLHWEFDAVFVRQETKNILEREKVQGIRFTNPVIHKTSIPIEGFYQLHIDTILNKGFDSYNTKTITCKLNNEENLNTDKSLQCCGQVKFRHPMIGGYLFNKKIFEPGIDIAESFEYFGSAGSAYRLQIVSKRFREIVQKNKLKGLSFTPIVHDKLVR